MPREVGDRYVCEKCGAQLVYEKPCPCPGCCRFRTNQGH